MSRHATALPRWFHAWRGGREVGGSRASSAPLLHPVAQPCHHPQVHIVTCRAAQPQAGTAMCNHTPCPQGRRPHLAVCTQMPSHVLTQGHSQPWRHPPSRIHGHGCTCIIPSQHQSHRVLAHSRTTVLPTESGTHSDIWPQVTHAPIKAVPRVAVSRLQPRHLLGEPVASPVI